MPAIEQPQLKILIQEALETASDIDSSVVNPQDAREQLAIDLSKAVEAFVIGRTTQGTTSNGATATTIIQ